MKVWRPIVLRQKKAQLESGKLKIIANQVRDIAVD